MRRNMTRRTAMTAFAGSLAALRMKTARAAGETLRVGKAVVENVGFIPLDVGMEVGIFQKHGLAIEELNFAGGAKIAQAMTAGAVDISLSAGPDMQFVAKGAPEIAIGSIAEFPGYMAYVVAANSGVHGIDDLRGKKIGITSPGSLTDWLAEELDRVKGWSGASDRVTKVAVGGSTPAVIAALKTGAVDASITSTQLGLQMGENGEGRLLFDCSAYVGTIELYTMFASKTIVERNPDAVRRFLAAWYETVDFMKSHKAESVAISAKVMGHTPGVESQVYDRLVGKLSSNGKFSSQAIETLKASFVAMKSVDESVDMKKLYTEEFLPKISA
ncbi:MAG TPA: ABC transporter substrate-binding protein [Stellaceae bacterium]|jgi:ABC-type nitrate/sulfonate/bicarbonate transport system substrate-binding protein|nr:ABC transporter substrate-binding protein [Stellaceae bacterium]